MISDKPEERHKRQTESEPKEETKPVDGHEVMAKKCRDTIEHDTLSSFNVLSDTTKYYVQIVKRQSYDEEAVVEPAQPTETPEDPANDQADEVSQLKVK